MEKTEERVYEEKPNLGDTEYFDYTVEYSDQSYEDYIERFEQNTKKRLVFRFIKRSFDILASFLMLVILSPIFLIISILIKIDSRGPVIFKQKRVGRNGELFTCLKFRSMRTDAPKDMPTSLFKDSSCYQTRVGKILRRLSLDELPQLFCVFIGTMSFIGYRPLVPNEEKCNEMRERLGVFSFRPGISGYAQVNGRDDVYYKNKAILDAEYVKRASVWFDLKLILQTVGVVLKRKGNDATNKSK